MARPALAPRVATRLAGASGRRRSDRRPSPGAADTPPALGGSCGSSPPDIWSRGPSSRAFADLQVGVSAELRISGRERKDRDKGVLYTDRHATTPRRSGVSRGPGPASRDVRRRHHARLPAAPMSARLLGRVSARERAVHGSTLRGRQPVFRQHVREHGAVRGRQRGRLGVRRGRCLRARPVLARAEVRSAGAAVAARDAAVAARGATRLRVQRAPRGPTPVRARPSRRRRAPRGHAAALGGGRRCSEASVSWPS